MPNFTEYSVEYIDIKFSATQIIRGVHYQNTFGFPVETIGDLFFSEPTNFQGELITKEKMYELLNDAYSSFLRFSYVNSLDSNKVVTWIALIDFENLLLDFTFIGNEEAGIMARNLIGYAFFSLFRQHSRFQSLA